MTTFLDELHVLMNQGGIVLWLMCGLSIILYTTMATSWLGVFQLKSDIAGLENDLLGIKSRALVQDRVELFELDRLAWVQRRLPVLSVLIALAPLAGLLGTVSGILNTFDGMASSDASLKPIDSISSGISEALVTTQTGLLIAIPGAILFSLLKSRFQHLIGQLEHCATRHNVALVLKK